MAVFEQLPGYLALSFRQGDDFTTNVAFDFNALNYSWQADVRSTITGESVQQITVTVTDAASGEMTLSLTDEQTADLPAGTWGWTLVGSAGGVKRTYLSGFVEVIG